MDGGGMWRRGDNVEHATKISTIKKSGTRMENAIYFPKSILMNHGIQ
jgi:hypothetical protein